MGIEVIGAGFGRTGTLSLKAALERLGYDPCYHMTEVLTERPGANDGHVEAWHGLVCEGRPMDWKRLLAAYRACTDFPTCLFWRELLLAFPDARVVLTVRDPDAWFESWRVLQQTADAVRAATASDPRMRQWGDFEDTLLRVRTFGGVIERDANVGVFQRHIADVKQTLPPERLLVFEVREGWGPLCSFLGCEPPDEPFPHLNERAVMERIPAALAARDGSAG